MARRVGVQRDVLRRHAVIGCDHEQGLVEQALPIEHLEHATDAQIGLGECVGKPCVVRAVLVAGAIGDRQLVVHEHRAGRGRRG